jgi:hypothetical protein
MTDETGPNAPHKVVHRRFKVQTCEDSFYTANTNASAPYGKTVNDAAQAATGPYSARIIFNDYLSWNVSSDSALPYGWTTLGLTSGQESVLKENVIEKSKGLKADVLLNLVEANQIWPSVTSLTSKLIFNQHRLITAGAVRRFRHLAKTASGAFLAWKFGLKPILSDIEAIHRYLPKLQSDVKRHADGDKIRYSSVGRPVWTFVATGSQGSLNGHVVDIRQPHGKLNSDPEVRYVLVVKPTVKYGTTFFQKADAFMTRFATSPASLLWEKIPFSFVVDWFVDLRGVLRAVDNSVGFAPYEVVSFTRSHSYHLESSLTWENRNSCDGASLWKVTCGTAEHKHYERIPVSMGPSGPTLRPRFGKSQAGISAALITQYLSKLRS